MRNGFTEAQARERISAGCHWFCMPGLEYPMNDLPKINIARVLEVAFDEMMNEKTPHSPTTAAGGPSIENLWRRFIAHLDIAVGAAVAGVRHHLKYQSRNEPELLCNPLMVGPVEKGLNVTDGAAAYYNICIDGCGLAVVADSLAALEQRVEREKKLTYSDIAGHLKENFEGADGEYVRQMMLHSERYCGGDTRGDYWGVKLTEEFTRLALSRNDAAAGIRYIPGWFSWSNTISFGRAVGATPNGRKAREPISHGANPTGGFRKDGAVTAMCNTIASVQPGYGNTAPVQLELDPGLALTDEAVWKMVHMIRTLFESGNTLLNINIIDAKKILDAHKDPTKYPDLVVRVTGFSAYFAMLTKEFRQLVVDRILAVNGEDLAAG
jgi:formate C-acetyltransferase